MKCRRHCVGRGIKIPTLATFWGLQVGASRVRFRWQRPTLTNGNQNARAVALTTLGTRPAATRPPANFKCNPSRIDASSITTAALRRRRVHPRLGPFVEVA